MIFQQTLEHMAVFFLVFAVGFVLLAAPVPGIIQDALGTISSATSGLCMLYLGALASFSHVVPVLRRPELYVGICFRSVHRQEIQTC